MAFGGGPFNNSNFSQLMKVLLFRLCKQILNNYECYNTINKSINITQLIQKWKWYKVSFTVVIEEGKLCTKEELSDQQL